MFKEELRCLINDIKKHYKGFVKCARNMQKRRKDLHDLKKLRNNNVFDFVGRCPYI